MRPQVQILLAPPVRRPPAIHGRGSSAFVVDLSTPGCGASVATAEGASTHGAGGEGSPRRSDAAGRRGPRSGRAAHAVPCPAISCPVRRVPGRAVRVAEVGRVVGAGPCRTGQGVPARTGQRVPCRTGRVRVGPYAREPGSSFEVPGRRFWVWRCTQVRRYVGQEGQRQEGQRQEGQWGMRRCRGPQRWRGASACWADRARSVGASAARGAAKSIGATSADER